MSARPLRLRLAAPWLVAVSLLAACESTRKAEPVQPLPPPVVQRPPILPGPVSEEALAPPPGTAAPEKPSRLPPVAPGGARAAILLPLSGGLADIGKGLLNASQMAIFDVSGARLQIVPYDTGARPEEARAAAEQAIGENAQLILGPMLAASTKAVQPVAKNANVPVISFSSDRKVAGDGVYIMGFTPEAEVARVVGYAASVGATRFVLLTPRGTYGETVAASMRTIAKEQRLTLARIEIYDPSTKDFGPVVERLKALSARAAPSPAAPAPAAATGDVRPTPIPPGGPIPAAAAAPAPSPFGFDAILIADGGERLRALARQLAAAGMGADKVRLLGTGAWDEPDLGREPALDGAWFAAPDPSYRRDFGIRYRRAFGADPPRLATLGYDAAALAAVLSAEAGRSGYSASMLTNPEGFLGSDGLFRLQSDGVADRRLAVLQVRPDGAVVISEPPRRFLGES